jgi:hypothetical protein
MTDMREIMSKCILCSSACLINLALIYYKSVFTDTSHTDIYMLRHVLTPITQWMETHCSPDSFVMSWKREYFSNTYAKN